MIEIAGHVKDGAMAYLKRQYKVVALVFLVLLVVLQALAWFGIQNPFVPFAFLTGGFFSGLCGFIGMKTATAASARTAQGCSESLNRGLQVAFRSGAVMGLVVVGLGLLDICIWYFALDKVFYTAENMANGLSWGPMEIVPVGCTVAEKLVHMTTTMITFGMGASTQALFARVGGGIYTKAADVGADLVGKVEAGIPEDDPRNPATIADNVGDNVGDVAGMGADLYESYCGSILATAALGAAVGAHQVMAGTGTEAEAIGLVTAPMVVAGVGTLLSIVGMFMVRCKEGASQKNLLKALLTGTLGSSVLIVLALIGMWQLGMIAGGIVLSVISGLFAGVIIGQATEYYTSDEYKPTQGIAGQAVMGPATTIIDGLATRMYSAGIPVITIVIGIICAFGFAGGFSDMSMGLYGIGFAAVGMLATLGITLATDAYGPIADNAGGNAEMAHLGSRSARAHRRARLARQHHRRDRQRVSPSVPPRSPPWLCSPPTSKRSKSGSEIWPAKPVNTSVSPNTPPSTPASWTLFAAFRAAHHEPASALRTVYRRHDGLCLLRDDHERPSAAPPVRWSKKFAVSSATFPASWKVPASRTMRPAWPSPPRALRKKCSFRHCSPSSFRL